MGYCNNMCYHLKMIKESGNFMYEKLKLEREKSGLSYEKMAKRLGISKCFYWQLENRKRKLSYEMAKKIAKIFSLKPDDLFYEK